MIPKGLYLSREARLLQLNAESQTAFVERMTEMGCQIDDRGIVTPPDHPVSAADQADVYSQALYWIMNASTGLNLQKAPQGSSDALSSAFYEQHYIEMFILLAEISRTAAAAILATGIQAKPSDIEDLDGKETQHG